MKLLVTLSLLVVARAGLVQHHGHATSYQNVNLQSHGSVPVAVKSDDGGHSAAILSTHGGEAGYGVGFEAGEFGSLDGHGFAAHQEDFGGFEGHGGAGIGDLDEHAGLGGFGSDAGLHHY